MSIRQSPEAELGAVFKERGWTLAVAETTAGGLICSRIVSVPGSSAYFESGIVAYGKASKEMLGVAAVMEEHGAVSEKTARAMAEGVRSLTGTTIGIAETGIGGPIQGRSAKPLGTAYIAIADEDGSVCERHLFGGNRLEIREQIANRAIQATLEFVVQKP